jgi:hypothetical protein
VPLTALLRIPEARRALVQGQPLAATLELYLAWDEESVSIAGEQVPLETEPTAALALTFTGIPVVELEMLGLLGRLSGVMRDRPPLVSTATALIPKNMGVWNHKPFSIHITAGPDTIVPGDKLGFDLPNNLTVQQHLRNFVTQGHEVGNHGGWIHDYYGDNANETNQAQFEPYLVLNRNAVQAVIGKGSTEYSAPQGNNPLWAVTWLQQNGVNSFYSLSHTGSAVTRSYRGGGLPHPAMWAVPVTPFGVAATFEEFEELMFTEAEINQWYKDLMDFASNNETNRMIYAHPPGAVEFPNVMNTMLQYAKTQQAAGKFRWYTMSRLRNFMVQRSNTTWQSAIAPNGMMRVTASNTTTNLVNLTWAYPKTKYSRPVAVSGTMTIVDQGTDWLVRITAGKNATFDAAPL